MSNVEVYQPPHKKEKIVVDKLTRMHLVTVLIPRMIIDAIDDLVRDEVFPNRAEAIRASILLMLIELGKLKNDTELIKLLIRRTPSYKLKNTANKQNPRNSMLG